MEQSEKTQEVPVWVKIVGDFPPVVQQSLGNLCASAVQNLAMVSMVSYDLFRAIVSEVDTSAVGDSFHGVSPD